MVDARGVPLLRPVRSAAAERRIIRGSVSPFREPLVTLVIKGPNGEELEIEAVMDTGFTEYVTLPPDLVLRLGLSFCTRGRAILADGSECTFERFEAFVDWEGQRRRILVDAADSDPLAGMNLIYGSELTIQAVDGGEVLIRPLPQQA